MYDKCYFCLDQLPKLKKESTASFFVTFWRSRGTKEPAYITVDVKVFYRRYIIGSIHYGCKGLRQLHLKKKCQNNMNRGFW